MRFLAASLLAFYSFPCRGNSSSTFLGIFLLTLYYKFHQFFSFFNMTFYFIFYTLFKASYPFSLHLPALYVFNFRSYARLSQHLQVLSSYVCIFLAFRLLEAPSPLLSSHHVPLIITLSLNHTSPFNLSCQTSIFILL